MQQILGQLQKHALSFCAIEPPLQAVGSGQWATTVISQWPPEKSQHWKIREDGRYWVKWGRGGMGQCVCVLSPGRGQYWGSSSTHILSVFFASIHLPESSRTCASEIAGIWV